MEETRWTFRRNRMAKRSKNLNVKVVDRSKRCFNWSSWISKKRFVNLIQQLKCFPFKHRSIKPNKPSQYRITSSWCGKEVRTDLQGRKVKQALDTVCRYLNTLIKLKDGSNLMYNPSWYDGEPVIRTTVLKDVLNQKQDRKWMSTVLSKNLNR